MESKKIAIVGGITTAAGIIATGVMRIIRRKKRRRLHPRNMNFVHARFGSGTVLRLAPRGEQKEPRYLVHYHGLGTEGTALHSELHPIKR